MSQNFQVPNVFVAPVLPVRDAVVFPRTVMPLLVGRPKSALAVEAASSSDKRIILVTQKSPKIDDPSADELFDVGTVAEILQMLH